MKKKISYARWLELQKYSLRSQETLLSLVKQLQDYLLKHGLLCNGESIHIFMDWLAKEGYSLAYQKQFNWGIRMYIKYLNQVLGKGIKVHLCKLGKLENGRRALSKKRLEQLEKWLDQEGNNYWLNQSLWLLFYGLGLRRGEVLKLYLGSIKIREKVLYVDSLKGGKARILPLSSPQLHTLTSYIKEERNAPKVGYENKLFIGKRGGKAEHLLSSQLKHWQKESGLGQDLCWHVLRHSIATELVKQGMRLEEVSRFLGHRQIGSTSRYLDQKLSDEKL